MDIKKLQALVIDALEDVKAQDIKVYDTSHLTSLFDRIAIASGTSNRQTKALAASVRDKVKQSGGNVLSMEGEDTGEWVLVDLGDMIVHIMQPTIRAYYRLEEIWGEKEVKFGAAVRISKRTASADEAEAPKKARHLTVNKTSEEATPKKASRTSTSTRKPAAPGAKSATGAARKPAAAKSATGKAKPKPPSKPVGKTIKVASTKTAVASKGAAVKKAAAKGPARAPAKRAPRAAAKPKADS
jgi:ribosome-associated protein